MGEKKTTTTTTSSKAKEKEKEMMTRKELRGEKRKRELKSSSFSLFTSAFIE